MTKQLASIALMASVIALTLEAFAVDLPKRKSGLWDIKISRAGANRPAQTIQMCIDQKTDNMAQQMFESRAREACSKQQIRREGNKIVGDSVCKIGETTATSHTVFSGEFDRAYRGEIRTKFSPPLMGKDENLTLIDAKWTGPCQAEQKPGDMIMPNGMKINIHEMQQQQ
jgi:Protein of unknown function (DUF3617)